MLTEVEFNSLANNLIFRPNMKTKLVVKTYSGSAKRMLVKDDPAHC